MRINYIHSVKIGRQSTNQKKQSTLQQPAPQHPAFTSEKPIKTEGNSLTLFKNIAGGLLIIGAIIGFFLEKKAAKKMESEKDAANKLKNELEERYKKLLDEANKKLEESEKKIQDLITNLKKEPAAEEKLTTENTIRQADSDNSIINEIRELSQQVKETESASEEAKNVILKNRIINQADSINDLPGFTKVAGYKKEKEILINKFLKPLKEGKEDELPNVILLYGPKGTGKSFIANAFSEEFILNKIKIDTTLDPKEDLKALKQAAQDAEKIYKETGKLSIIRIDEIDSLFETNDKNIIEAYKNLIQNLMKKSHAAIIGTTNHPKSINETILNLMKSDMIYIPPINREDMPALLQHYAEHFTDSSVNFNEISDFIFEKAGENAYSSDKISSLIRSRIKELNSMIKSDGNTQLLNQKELMEIFENSKPDITKESLKNYKI